MEYEIDTECRQRPDAVGVRQNTFATDLDPSVFYQRPIEARVRQKGMHFPEEELA